MTRHKGLERRTAIKRTPTIARRTGKLPAFSEKRRADYDRHVAVVQAVFARDGFRCRAADLDFGPCWGSLTPHHVLKSSQGGKTVPDNLLTLCVGHNDRVEDEPARARALGLVTYAWEAKADAT